jgi:hypothetical protein
LSPSINDIAKLYIFIADYDKKWQKNEYRAKIRAKSTAQMSGKVSNIQDIQEIKSSYSKLNKKCCKPSKINTKQ